MSPTVESAVAPAALDMEALQRKLIALRGEIDAIVLQLAALTRPDAAACAAPATEAPAQAGSATPATAETVPAETAAPEAVLGTEAASEEAERDLDAPKQADAPDETETAEPSLDVMPTMEKPAATLADALAACEVMTADATAAAASIDAEVTSRGPASPVTEDVVPVDTTAEGPRVDAEPKSDAQAAASATMIDASASPAPTGEAAPAAEEPVPTEVAVAVATTVATGADVAPEPPAAAAEATTPASEAPAAAAAAAIRFEPRQRKEKADLAAPRSVAASRGRRVASRIAAGIVALIAAAGALVLADREAFGGPYTLPWVSPLPSYQMPWSLFGQHKRAEAGGTGVYAVDGAAASEALLARYREVWPVSP